MWRLDQLERPREGRLVGGVCAGLAERLAVDPTLLRLAFILLFLAKGVGLVVYAALWLLMPTEGEAASPAMRARVRGVRVDVSRFAERGRVAWRRAGASRWPRPLDRRWIAVGLLLLGLAIVLASFGVFDWITPARAIGLALTAAGLAVLAGMPRR
ncbi:MAG: PspC domain-containing protein [Myxococcota bacterium]